MKKYLFLMLVSLSVFLASCLKDKEVDDQKYGLEGIEDKKLIELTLTPGASSNYKLLAFDIVNKDTTFDLLPVTFAFKDPAPEDIQVELIPNPALLGSYNADHGTLHEQAPASVYNISSPASPDGGYIVTIPKGSRKATVEVTLNPNDFVGHDYAMTFQISKIITPGYTISVNFATAIIAVALKNQYDGKYTYDVCSYHPTGNPNYDCGTTTVELRTSGTSSVKVFWPLGNGYGGPMIYNGSLNWFGAQEPEFTVNPTTNKVTVTNSYSGATTFYTTITAASGYDTRYDPATKTFYIRYGYNYDPGPVFNPVNNREWTIEATYTGPR